MGRPDDSAPERRTDGRDFVRRVWTTVFIVATLGGAILLLWIAYEVALLFFASVLLAIFLRTLTNWVSRITHLRPGWSLTVVLVGLVIFFGLIGLLLAAPIARESQQLSEELPKAFKRLEAGLGQYGWGQALVARVREPTGLFSQAGTVFSKVQDVFSITAQGLLYAWVILFCGFYLATQPQYYIEGFLRLIPAARRPRGRVVLQQIGQELQHWLFGQILSMAIIGLLTWLGLFLLGIPLSAVLGLLAGILDFVPVVGPWIAGIIAGLLALLKSPLHALYVAGLFIMLHFFEGEILVPQVQKHATRLPPVLTILALVLFAMLFGIMGLFLATPLLALVMIATKALYVEEVVENSPRNEQ